MPDNTLLDYLRSPSDHPFCTPFLGPDEQERLKTLVGEFRSFSFFWMGGYRGATYKRLLAAPCELDLEPDPGQWIGALELEERDASPLFNRVLMEDKIGRGMLGDMLERRPFFQLLAAREHLERVTEQVKELVKIETQQIPLGELLTRGATHRIFASEASLRLDAVASAGFRISRSQMTLRIKRGEVRLNRQEVRTPHKEVKSGDMVSLMFKGRLRLLSVQITAKNRYRIELDHYQ